ncbi:ABC transporter substrate-binding protein [Vineibacter terrae]|uniref:ABC transporter substrate-binding protein n=1 Tax=Vineibacter terrae TaxID=2586908 RepID=A0A5C8PQY6_9HYPH|nr:ABC transporter substrate-binding protein [Vineibacter terrae]TXL78151.1 ABC transporter substrate-binding protein [Vineibacter terrae]
MVDDLRRRDVFKLAGGATSLALAGTAFTQRAAAQDVRTLTIAWDTDIDTLDPAAFKSIGAYVVQANVYDSPLMWKVQPEQGKPGLFRSRPGEFDPSAAQAWSFEKDGATVVLKIRDGLTLPSGKPVTAHTVKYAFDRGLQSPGYIRLLFPVLLGVTKPEQIVVRDDKTLAIEMPAPSPMALDVLALSNNAILDPDEVKAHASEKDPWATDWLKRNVAGVGPYRLVKNEPGVEVVLEAAKNYWRPQPFFQRLVFKFVPSEADRVLLLKRRAVDIVTGRPGLSPRNVKSLEGEAGLKIFSVPDTTCHWLSMNTKKAPFDNVKVRQAINYAIPINAIIPSVLFGYGTQMKSPVPSLTPGYDDKLSPYKHDIAKAKALMSEAGVGPLPITIELAVRVGWQPHEQAAVWIQRELEQIGFKVNIVKETDATFRQVASKGGHQLSIETWQSWINDPFYHLHFNFHSKSVTTNTAFYANPELDKLIEENMRSPHGSSRLAAARRAQQILIDDAVWGFLWYDSWTRVMRADLVGVEKRWDTFERYYGMKLA